MKGIWQGGLVAVVLCLWTTTAQALTVGLWDRFEVEVPNDASYADPYRDTELRVRYRSPSGKDLAFWGFYAGGSSWGLRFMPSELGTWTYEATFSDGRAGAGGSFDCVPSTLPGLLAADEGNPWWFGFKGGRHLLVRSFHVGDRFFASNFADADRSAFLDWSEQQGYNMLSIASHYLNRNSPGRGAGWKTPGLWPLDAAAWLEMERILDDLAARRMLVFPFAGFFGKESNFPTETADQELYLRYALARIGPYWNVLLNVAGPEPALNDYLPRADVERLGRKLRELDVFGHLVSVHNKTGDDTFRDSDWTTYGVLQGPKTTSHSALGSGLLDNHSPSKPLYAQETLWPGNKYHPAYSDNAIRQNAIILTMSATALNFADMNGDSSSGFSGSLDLGTVVQSRHDIVRKVWDFFEGTRFFNMKPSNDLASNGFTLADAGKEYLVYLVEGGTVNVEVEVATGPYAIEWINARDPVERRPLGTTVDGHNLSAPDTQDWFLSLVGPSAIRDDGKGVGTHGPAGNNGAVPPMGQGGASGANGQSGATASPGMSAPGGVSGVSGSSGAAGDEAA